MSRSMLHTLTCIAIATTCNHAVATTFEADACLGIRPDALVATVETATTPAIDITEMLPTVELPTIPIKPAAPLEFDIFLPDDLSTYSPVAATTPADHTVLGDTPHTSAIEPLPTEYGTASWGSRLLSAAGIAGVRIGAYTKAHPIATLCIAAGVTYGAIWLYKIYKYRGRTVSWRQRIYGSAPLWSTYFAHQPE